MKTPLTPFLLKFLYQQGYQYLLSKTENINSSHASVSITLTPVVEKPVLRRLPRNFDTYFRITKEPRVMARGVDDTLIMVRISATDVAKLKELALNRTSQTQQYA